LPEVVKQYHRAKMLSVGAGAFNQTIKAFAIAKDFVAPQGIDLICIPAFSEITIDGEERTAIKLFVEPRR
jgi:stage V sporulation protein S